MTVDPAPPPKATQASDEPRRTSSAWNWLLVIPLLGTLFPAVYNKAEPTLFDMPFFYWYQLLWIPISVLLTLTVFRATRGDR